MIASAKLHHATGHDLNEQANLLAETNSNHRHAYALDSRSLLNHLRHVIEDRARSRDERINTGHAAFRSKRGKSLCPACLVHASSVKADTDTAYRRIGQPRQFKRKRNTA